MELTWKRAISASVLTDSLLLVSFCFVFVLFNPVRFCMYLICMHGMQQFLVVNLVRLSVFTRCACLIVGDCAQQRLQDFPALALRTNSGCFLSFPLLSLTCLSIFCCASWAFLNLAGFSFLFRMFAWDAGLIACELCPFESFRWTELSELVHGVLSEPLPELDTQLSFPRCKSSFFVRFFDEIWKAFLLNFWI